MSTGHRTPIRLAAVAGVLILAACAPGSTTTPAEGEDPHARLACAECHDGGLVEGRELAAVPAATCSSSGCHERDIPGEVRSGSVTFTHRDHGSTETLQVGCAGCHRHEAGGEPVDAGAETCGLCHQEELTGEAPEDCRLCHTTPAHVAFTSQQVAIPHEGLPWIEGGCVRCHYEVTHPAREVPLEECADCHREVEELAEESVGENLHPSHTGVSCTSCHEEDTHRVEAMSSAVDLQCATCHVEEHGVEVAEAGFTPASCNQCHLEDHQATQRLLLGVVLDEAEPSHHFSRGLTCASCHTEAPGIPGSTPRATGQACVDCHRGEYRTVERWWAEGVRTRTSSVERYLDATAAALGADAARVVEARALLAAVADGNGEHNLPLAHRLLEASLEVAGSGYREAGRTPPRPPELGREPRPGLCSYCHYRVGETGITEEMDDAFHRAVMGR